MLIINKMRRFELQEITMKFSNRIMIITLLVLSTTILAQSNSTVEFVVSDQSEGTANLVVGLDSNATEGLDPFLSERELPPLPPNGIFDSRLKLPTNVYSLVDIRQGTTFGSGKEFIMQWQLGENASGYFMEWTLPENVEMNIQDMNGSQVNNNYENGPGELLVNNEQIRSLKVTLYTKVVGVNNDETPKSFSLKQNYPNPFNPSTTIEFQLPVTSNVKINLYNSLGQKVKQITNNSYAAGTHQVNLNASDLPSGIYIYSIKANGVNEQIFKMSRKMMLIK